MTCVVEILEIKSVVPYLIYCSTAKELITNLEFRDKDYTVQNKDNVYALSNAGDRKLKEYASVPDES